LLARGTIVGLTARPPASSTVIIFFFTVYFPPIFVML
jgi:hypothetical protein